MTTNTCHPQPSTARYVAAQQIADCDLCDDDGIRGVQRCDHQDWAAIAERGMAKVWARTD